MARYPHADWRPLGRQSEPRLTRKNVVVLHTMVGSLDGTDAYFRRSGYYGVESHFGIGHDGTVYQWQDTNYQADAQAAGNDNCISIETADSGPGFPSWSGSDVPAWNTRQIDAIIKLVRWLCDTHDIPKRRVPDSGDRRRGIGYHRQGVDPWRKDDTERWSSSYGKVCPGTRRIAQLKNVIIPRLNGDDMQLSDQVKLNDWMVERWGNKPGIADGEITVRTALGSGYGHARVARENTVQILVQLKAQQATIDKLVDAVAAGPGIDLDALKQEIRDAIESVRVSLTVDEEAS